MESQPQNLEFRINPENFHACIIQLLGYCITTWYPMSQSLVKLTEIGTSWGHG